MSFSHTQAVVSISWGRERGRGGLDEARTLGVVDTVDVKGGCGISESMGLRSSTGTLIRRSLDKHLMV